MPEGWAWCRLPEICVIPITDGTHQTPTYSDKENGVPFLSSKDVTSGKIDWSKIKYITKELHQELQKRIAPKKDDILLAKNGTTGVAAIVEDETIFDIYVTLAVIRPNQKIVYPKFLLNIVNSPFCKNQFNEHLTGIGVPNLHLVDINKTFVPLPPLNEQRQITDKIGSYTVHIDELEKNKSDLQTAINKTKSKILDLVIHGKLVPQDPNDEPAEELLKRISTSDNRPYEKIEEGDIPFEIPPSWKWTTIKNIVNYIGDGDWIESKDQSDKGIRLIQTGNIEFGTFKDKEGKYHYISENTFSRLGCNEIFEGDILISRLPEPVGRACILPKVPERMITAVDCTIIRLNEELFQKELFVYYTISNKYLELIKENCTGTTRLRISRSNLEKIFIPIPPLNEQKRILNRIKKLFETLDEIILNLV